MTPACDGGAPRASSWADGDGSDSSIHHLFAGTSILTIQSAIAPHRGSAYAPVTDGLHRSSERTAAMETT